MVVKILVGLLLCVGINCSYVDAFIASDEFTAIAYAEEDDTYDGFYNQREKEYKDEYGDDHEDAIQDGWEEKHR